MGGNINKNIMFFILFFKIITAIFGQDSQSNNVVFPITLNEAYLALDNMLSSEVIEDIKLSSVNDLIKYHRNLGMWIRNNWFRAPGSRLGSLFTEYLPRHMDDLSQAIIIGYHYYLNGIEKTIEELLNE